MPNATVSPRPATMRPLLLLCLCSFASQWAWAATEEALELRPAAPGATLALYLEAFHREGRRLTVAGALAEGESGAAPLHAEYSWSGGWPSSVDETPLDPRLLRLHLSGGSSGLLLRVEAEPAQCADGRAPLQPAVRRTICAALVEALGLTANGTVAGTRELLSCEQLGLAALSRVPKGATTEQGGGALSAAFDLPAYSQHGAVVPPGSWPSGAYNCIAVARFPLLSLPGGMGFFTPAAPDKVPVRLQAPSTQLHFPGPPDR